MGQELFELERFDAQTDTGRLHACHEIYLAGAPVDDPCRPLMSLRAFAGWLAWGWTEAPSHAWLAISRATHEPVGWYQISLPVWENRHVAMVTPVMHPCTRRAGGGTRLLWHAAGQAQAQGRTLLSGQTRDGAPGEGFARRLGARPGMPETHRVLTLADVPAGQMAALRRDAERAARGYLMQWWSGTVPDRDLAGIADLYLAENDAPRDPDREPSVWSGERVRQSERRITAAGLRYYTLIARHEASGQIAGLTQLGVDPLDPSWGYQELTAVAGQHRGHRLGLLVKIAMLELLAGREPQLTRILTGNADDNKHMIAINETLGFRPADRWRSWTLPVQAARTPGRPTDQS